MEKSAGTVLSLYGQKLMRPHVGRSYWSRWQLSAYASVLELPPVLLTQVPTNCAVTNTPKSALARPDPAGMVVAAADGEDG